MYKMKVNVYITTLYLLIVISRNGINCFQRFQEQPKYSEVNPGQDALLTCKVIDKRGTCSWQKDNKPVGIYAKKYEWAARTSNGNGALHLDLHPPPMQIGGDCSLWIRSATLDFDDGLWECQVTASDFTTQDALTSHPVRLVVRVAPQRPRLEYEGIHVPPGQNITTDSGSLATIKCVSHYGNPPATLKWYLGDQELEPIHPQINNTEADNPRTWSATSVVQLTAMRERHGDILRCLAYHESYAGKTMSVDARLDVKYAPIIRLIGSPEHDLEEDRDALVLRCVADANPPASIVWRRAGRSEIASLQETLQLRPVGRRDAGLYTCQAQNSVGSSEQLSVQLDVKYPPKIISAGPDRLTTAPLFSPAAFECIADGNPMPTYKWVQRISYGSTKFIERGQEPRLVIDNITYDHQGEYECRATSYINGQERVAVSEPVSLQVVGAPQVMRLHSSHHTVVVKKGEPASLTLVVCADPRPIRVAWEWGSLRLDAGSNIDRFHADDMVADSREDCFLSTLHIQKVNEHDSRPYYLVVENERGIDRLAMHLNVDGMFAEPLEMSYLLGIASGSLAAVLILICLCIYAVRSKKCCFKGTSGYKSSDKDSEKADLKSRSNSTSGTGPSSNAQTDGVYTNPSGGYLSPPPTATQTHQPFASGLSGLSGLGVRDVSSLMNQHAHGGSSSPEAMKCTKATKTKTSTSAATMRTRTAVHYNPSILCNNAYDDDDDDEHNHDIRPPTVDHILWQEKANEFIKQCYKNDTKQQKGTTFKVLSRHSTGGNNDVGVLYTHPSAIAMMTLNKRASQGDMPRGRAQGEQLILPENNGLAGNELLTARKRHLRDLFSGDLGLPPVPPPPPLPPLPPMPLTAGSHAPSQRTHVGNVVHTFETLAMQRRLAAFTQHEQHQLRIKNALQTKHKQKQNESSTFSKYLKSNNRNTKQKQQQQQQHEQSMPHCSATIINNNFSTHMKSNNTTFNERNKQISQQFLQQMEIDYRKNLFSKQSHVNNNTNHKFNNNNNNINDATISEGEAGVVAKFDEMLAGYSTTAADEDEDDDDDDVDMDNNARVSIININRNEAQNNVFHINLSSTTTNGRATKSENLTDTCTNIKQLKCSNTNQPLLPIMRKKPVAPLPPPKPQTKTTTTTTTTPMQTTSKQQFIESCNHVLSQQYHNQAESNAQLVESNAFLRGTTLSQSFVCQPNWQHRKKPKAPKPPILPITTPVVKNITKNKQIKTNTQLRIAITNPFRHVLRLNSKNSDSFNLLQNVN